MRMTSVICSSGRLKCCRKESMRGGPTKVLRIWGSPSRPKCLRAWLIEFTMPSPESLSVPSRSKRMYLRPFMQSSYVVSVFSSASNALLHCCGKSFLKGQEQAVGEKAGTGGEGGPRFGATRFRINGFTGDAVVQRRRQQLS